MSSETMRRVRVIGFGNRTAGDLAVEIAAAWAREELRHDPSVEVIEASPGIRALNLFENAEAVVAVEAVHPSGVQRQPGRLVRAVAGPDWPKADVSQARSSDGDGLAEVEALAAALGTGKPVVFVGVEVADMTRGRPLSAPVAAALPSLVGMIIVEVARLASMHRPGGDRIEERSMRTKWLSPPPRGCPWPPWRGHRRFGSTRPRSAPPCERSQ